MGFLEAKQNLNGTKFKQEVLPAAQEFLRTLIGIHEPNWLTHPTGPLSQHWQREDLASVCFLIDFADTFGILQNNITQKSVPVLIDKLKSLLRSKDQEQFEEILVELQFARALCELASPISCEPFVPTTLESRQAKPASPDYAIRLPGTDVLIEVTAFYFGPLRDWIRAINNLGPRLSRLLEKRKASRQIEIIFPLEFNSSSLLSHEFLVALADEIAKTDRGKREIIIASKKGILEWRPLLWFDNTTRQFREAAKGELESKVGFAFGFQNRILEEDHNELFLNSLRKKLDQKRNQGNASLPYLIALILRHHSINVDGIMAAFRERIWPNPKYQWLTGILIFGPARADNNSPHTLNYLMNPNPAIKPPLALLKLLELGTRFHLKDGVFYSRLPQGWFGSYRHAIWKMLYRLRGFMKMLAG